MNTCNAKSVESLISCIDLTVAYGSDIVLNKVNIEISAGAFLPCIGPNGAGKTTFLRTILGLIEPLSGSVKTPFDRHPPGYLAQAQSIDPVFPITVRELVEMGLYPSLGWWGKPDESQRKEVDRLLAMFSLERHSDKTFHELSGGMKQKVLIARALVNGARVIVMDEPTTGLDDDSEREILSLLSKLSANEGKTVLFAQHGLELIENLADDAIVFHKGCVRKDCIKNLIRSKTR